MSKTLEARRQNIQRAHEALRKQNKKTATGHKHVHRHGKNFRVRFRVNGKIKNIGTRVTIERAIHLRDAALAFYGLPPVNGSIDISACADDDTRLLYDRKEAARQLSISVRSLDALIGNGHLDTRRIGKRVLIPRGALVKFARADHYGQIQNAPDKAASRV